MLGHSNARRADGNQLSDHDIQLMKAVAIDPDPSTNKRPKIKAQVCNGQVLVVTTGGLCLRNIISRFSQKKRFIGPNEMPDATAAYDHARAEYRRIISECEN